MGNTSPPPWPSLQPMFKSERRWVRGRGARANVVPTPSSPNIRPRVLRPKIFESEITPSPAGPPTGLDPWVRLRLDVVEGESLDTTSQDEDQEAMGYPRAREPPETKSRSAWKYRKDVSITANFEDYRRFIKQEVEKIRNRMLELEVWKTERLKKEATEAQIRQYQIDRLEIPPRLEERGPPAMPVPFNDLYAEPSDGLGHFIFTNAPDQYQELKIKSLCVQARIALTARSSKEAEAFANAACKLASEFDFEPIFAKAQFWRGAAAYQMGLWPTAIEAFKVGQKARGIYLEGAVSEVFLERAEMTLAQRREEAARMARVARVITVMDGPASVAAENSPDDDDSHLPPLSLAAELEGLSPGSSERSESVKSGDMDSSAGESDNEPFAYESY